MPLTKCPGCEKQHSTKAATCPNCGRPVRFNPLPPSSPRRKVGYVLGCAILLAPYVFAWFVLLQKGYSYTARILSFLWMTTLVWAFFFGGQSLPTNLTNSSVGEIAKATPTPELTAEQKLIEAKFLTSGEPTSEEMNKAMSFLRSITPEAKEYKEAQSTLKKITPQAAKVKADELLLGSKPESSEWDDSVRCVDKYLKATLNDYDSAEYLEWSPVTKIEFKGEPYWAVRLKLRAKNAYGGKIVKETYFFIRQNQVVNVVNL